MFTREVKINYITVWSKPNTPPLRRVMFLGLPTHQTSPAGSCPVAGCDDDSGLRLWSSARCCSSLCAVPTRLQKSLYLPPQLRASSFKRKTGLKASSPQKHVIPEEGCRHCKDNTWAQYYRGRPWREKIVVLPPPAFNVPPSHHCVTSGIQSVAREAVSSDWSIRLPLLADKVMLHLSTHRQQVTLACVTPKPKGGWAILSPLFSWSMGWMSQWEN